MKRFCMAILMVWPALPIAAQKIKADLLIRSATIIDVQSGRLITGKTIAVRDGMVLDVLDQQRASRYDAAQIVDAKGKYAMPGLWDGHMHFGGGDTLAHENKNLLPLFVAYGITAVRDCAADISDHVLLWRDSINAGTLQGPTIFTSGPKLEGYRSVWKGDIEIGTSAELQHALDSLQQLKVDFIKITDNTLQPALYLESIREARKRGFAVSGHVPYAIPMKTIVDAGISSIEHITYLLKAGSSEEENISRQVAAGELKGRALTDKIAGSFNKSGALQMYRYLAQHGTAVTPTLSLGYILAYFDEHDPRKDAYLQYIGKGLQKTYEGRVNNILKHDAEAIANRKAAFERSATLLPLLQQAGVKILAGTDAGYLNSYTYPGLGLHTELALMVKYGLTPLQALQASVINVPAFLGKKDYGSIAAGKKADIILLQANPLQNITNTQKIDAVITHGVYLNRQQLNALLTATAEKTAQGI